MNVHIETSSKNLQDTAGLVFFRGSRCRTINTTQVPEPTSLLTVAHPSASSFKYLKHFSRQLVLSTDQEVDASRKQGTWMQPPIFPNVFSARDQLDSRKNGKLQSIININLGNKRKFVHFSTLCLD